MKKGWAKGLALGLGLASAAVPVMAQDKVDKGEPVAKPPQLIVMISVDQFSSHLFSQYRGRYTGGLKRLQQGAVFPAGFQSHAATETCPGHSTILTGARPSRTGIIANNWFDLSVEREDKRVYCAEDPGVDGSNSRDYTPSADTLLVPTFGDYLKQTYPDAKTVAVAGKDRAAIMMGGAHADQSWWWGGDAFATLGGRSTPTVVQTLSARRAADVAQASPGYDVPESCSDSAIPVALEDGFTVGAGNFARKAGDVRAWRSSPDFDKAVLKLAEAFVDDMDLGKDSTPDLLAIGLSATDYIGHAFGSQGAEMCIQMEQLDAELDSFFTFLDEREIDYVVGLTADHGGHDLPERGRMQAAPQDTRLGAFSEKVIAETVAWATGRSMQEGLVYSDGAVGDIYLDRQLSPEEKEKAITALKGLADAYPAVAAVYSAAELSAAPLPAGPIEEWSLMDRARTSFYPGRSGDVVILAAHSVTPGNPGPGYVAGHGTPWDYDRKVPILFWRKGMRGFEQYEAVETVDIAPTLAAITNVSVPEGSFDGRCLDLDPSVATTCE